MGRVICLSFTLHNKGPPTTHTGLPPALSSARYVLVITVPPCYLSPYVEL